MTPWFGPRSRRRHPPPWWPTGEPWPPRSPAAYHERGARFIRRRGWWSFLPLWILAWVILANLRWFGRGGGLASGPVVVLLVAAAFAATVAAVLRFVAGPLAELSAAAHRIKGHDFRVRLSVPPRGPAWVADTIRAFNAMAGELEAQDSARRNTMADVAHELRTPLAILQGQIEGLIDGVYPRDDERLEKLLEETRMLGRLVEDLRTLSTAESGALALTREPTDVVALAGDVVAAFQEQADGAGIVLRVTGQDIPPIDLDPLRIREVLMNLVANALRHTPRDGRVEVRLSSTASAVDVQVVDTGVGMTEEQVQRVFDRFYKGAGSSGSGLGLTIARSLVEAHGGTIRAESRSGAGTTITVALPCSQAAWRGQDAQGSL